MKLIYNLMLRVHSYILEFGLSFKDEVKNISNFPCSTKI